MTRKRTVVLGVVVIGAVALAPAALAATPTDGTWVGKDTNPKQNEVSGAPTFKLADHGRLMEKFTIPDVSKYCAFIGTSAGPVFIPKAKVHGRSVSVKYDYGPKNFRAQYKLTGHFASATAFKGEVKGSKTCEFDVKLTAHPK